MQYKFLLVVIGSAKCLCNTFIVVCYKVQQILLQSASAFRCYKVRQILLHFAAAHFVTKCGKNCYKVGQLLQSEANIVTN